MPTSVAATEQAAQRAYLKATLEAVADIGRVHDRPRYGDAAEHWITTIDGVPQIRAWEIGLADGGVTAERLTANHRHRQRPWLIRGWVGLEDADDAATYKLIADLAADIADAVDVDPTWGGSALHAPPTTVGEPVVVTIGGGSLCWGITLQAVPYTVVHP